ncbi:MAG: hypothetical protein WDO74_07485 [Pseudomonadota bacterium]
MCAVRAKLFALLAASLMLLLALPELVSAHAQYYCQMSGHVVAACCCGAEISARASTRSAGTTHAPECRVADCCQRISSAGLAASPGAQQALQHVATAPLSFTVPAVLRVSAQGAARGACAESTQAPLAIGPPLFVQHCALLS